MSKKTNARELILGRIRQALQDVPASEQPDTHAIKRPYRHVGNDDHEQIIQRFLEHVADYKVQVQRVKQQEIAQALATICHGYAIQRLVVPVDIPPDWLPAHIELLQDDPPLSNEQLDKSDGVLTGCALGIAQTGTIVLDGGVQQGRRVLTLLPDRHICVISETQIVDLVPEAVMRLEETIHHHNPLTFISGPSATSDIELNRVEGVHGPRTLVVLVVQPDEESIREDT